ncbi:hypothetical protein AYK24_03020 [Thermoplasmatales archaeon SG8-52-4]|nr:MAG: hypothetical protein AYK24_03020 [Thermoplasmatales archaeon SG8-52-4]
MKNNKKSKLTIIEELHKILDNGSNKDIPLKDEKFLKALSERLSKTSREDLLAYKKVIRKDDNGKDIDSLSPKVVIYPRPVKKVVEFKEIEEKQPENKIPKPAEVEFLQVEELKYKDEELFEVEKVEVSGPEFLEVKPKEISKGEKIEEQTGLEKEEISFWEPVEVIEKKGEDISNKDEVTKDFKEIPAKPDETIIEETKKVEISDEKTKGIEIFKDFTSIDDKTAILLYNNGFNSIDSLSKASIKDLTKIKGIKRKKAKTIKKDLKKKTKVSKEKWEIIEEKKPINEGELPQWKAAEFEFEEIKEEKIEDKKIKEKEKQKISDNYCSQCGLKIKEMVNFCPECGQKITSDHEKNKEEKLPVFEQVKHVEDKIQDTKPEKFTEIEEMKNDLQTKTDDINKKDQTIRELEEALKEKQTELENKEKEIKLQVYKELDSIDDKTAVLLYNNGYSTIDALTTATIKDLTRIKGIKKKTAKALMKEMEKKHEWIQDDSKIVSKDNVKEGEFKDIKSIDEKIAKLLREKGINSIDDLRSRNIKDLIKIRGIKRKVAKQIKNEIEKIPMCLDSEEIENEWIPIEEKKIPRSKVKKTKGFSHGDYILYEKEMDTKSGKKKIVRYFSKSEPEDGKPIKLPKGYEVKENKKTGYPYLKKKK